MAEHETKGECEQRFKSVERDIKALFKKFDGVDNMEKTLIKLNIFMEIMIDDNKKRDDLNARQNDTLNKINENLTVLNTKAERTNEEVMKVAQELSNTNKKVDHLEEQIYVNEEKNKVDLRDPRKKKAIDILYKYAFPIGTIAWIIDILKNMIVG